MTVRMSTGRKAAFASGEAAFNLTWQSIELFLLFYYTDVMGLSPWWAGIIFTLGSIWDGLCDPVIGMLADRTRTRWGRFRPWVISAMPVTSVALAAVFYKPALAGAALVGYALVTHLLLRTTYTAASIPFLSLSARTTHEAGDRATIAGFRMQFAALAALTVSLGYPWAARNLGGSAEEGYFLASIAFGLLALPITLVSMSAANDPVEPPVSAPLRLGDRLRDEAAAFAGILRHNADFRRVLVAIVVVSVALTMVSKATLYYFKYELEAPEMAKWSLAIGAANLVVMAPVWAWIANRTSKRTAWLFASAIAATGMLALFLWPTKDPVAALILLWFAGIGSAGYAVLFWAMLPDTVEANEWATGSRDEAKLFALALFSRKLALAVNAFLLGSVLSAAGFVANVQQTPEALFALKTLFTLVPVAGAIVSAAVIFGYRLDGAAHHRLRELIAERAAVSEMTS